MISSPHFSGYLEGLGIGLDTSSSHQLAPFLLSGQGHFPSEDQGRTHPGGDDWAAWGRWNWWPYKSVLTYFGNDYVLVIHKTSPYISYHLLGRSTVETLGPNQCAKQGSAQRNWWLILSFHPPFTFVVRWFSCWVGVPPARKVVCTNLANCWFAVPLISLWLCGALWNSLWKIWQFHMHFLSFCGVVWMGERAPWEAEKIHIVWNLLWKIGHTGIPQKCWGVVLG